MASEFAPKPGDVLKALEMVEKVINSIYERRDLVDDNKDQLERVQRMYHDATRIIIHVRNQRRLDFISDVRVCGFAQTLSENEKKLQDWHQSIEDAKAWNRVKRMKQILDECERNAKEILEEFKPNISSQVQNASGNVGTDVYVEGMNNVPPNPDRLTFDFTSQFTPESRLKAAVLSEESNRSIAVIASGLGGAGKTCTLHEVCREAEVATNFPGGVLYMQLGNDSNLFTIIQKLGGVVRRTGGMRLARSVESMNSLEEACDAVAPWFKERKCLLVVDDIWPVNGINCDQLDVLKTILNDSSRLVYTTRDWSMRGGTSTVIEFREKEAQGVLARRMLMTHAGFAWDQLLSEENEQAVRAVLEQCDGLPLALGIAGAAVREIAEQRAENVQNAWKDYCVDPYYNNINKVVGERYGKLELIVNKSLYVLQQENREGDFEERFKKLCIVRKKQEVPLLMLQCLWGAEDLQQTWKLAKKLSDVSVFRIRRKEENSIFIDIHDRVLDIAVDRASKEYKVECFRTLAGNYKAIGRERGLELVDAKGLSIDQTAPERKERRLPRLMRHIRMCFGGEDGENDCGAHGDAGDDTGKEVRWAWWRFEDDGYIVNNLCRVLYEAGCLEELLWLLSQPQWIVMRLQERGMYYVNEDIEWGKSALRAKGSDICNHMKHLEMVWKAARMSSTYVVDNEREAWFQLHGRLLQHAQICERTRHFVEEIERDAPRPWARASIGLLQPASEVLEELINAGLNSRVLCLSESVHHVYFVVQKNRSNDLYWVSYDRKTGFRKLRKLRTEGKQMSFAYNGAISGDLKIVAVGDKTGKLYIFDTETCSLRRTIEGPGAEIYDVALSDDGTRVVTGSTVKRIPIWDVESGVVVRELLGDQANAMRCVSFSGDGRRVVSGSGDGTLRIWEVESEEMVGQPLVPHSAIVRCVALSSDGRRVLSGSYDGTLRILEVESGEMIGQASMGHANSVVCVAFSDDGRRVASGSYDGTVGVWEVESGEMVGQPLVGHAGTVGCVAFSGDGRRVVSGSHDGTLRIWKFESGEELAPPLAGHAAAVVCVAFSGDGRRVVFGSHDGTLLIWEVESEEMIGQPLVGHAGAVECVAFSGDGRRVVSGSHDRTLRIWEVESGEEVGQPLLGHTAVVWCVAFSGDGRRVVSGSFDRTLRVWDVRSGSSVCAPLEAGDFVTRVGANVDGTRVMCEVDVGSISEWDVEREQHVASLQAPFDEAARSMAMTSSYFLPQWYAAHRSESERLTMLGSFECGLIRTNGDVFRDATFRPMCEIVL